MGLVVPLALLLVYAALYRHLRDDRAGRLVVIFGAAAEAAIAVAEVTALNEHGFVLVLMPATAIATLAVVLPRLARSHRA